MASARSGQLLDLAQAVADALPVEIVEEVLLTGSVSRGVADDLSDIEMLVVSKEQLSLTTCFELAGAAGLAELDTWGDQDRPTRRVSGFRDGVPIELVWWSREDAEESIEALFRGEASSTADALAYGVPLRTSGLSAGWLARLGDYPEELAAVQIEEAALTWGGFAAAGLLTLTRPGERLALLERMVDDVSRVMRIVYAINRVWQPTHKRLAERIESLPVKPERLAERIDEALTEPDPRRALLVLTELQADTVRLAPDGPNVNRARRWLESAAQSLAGQIEPG